MKKTRMNIFETNSSSSHSIVLSKRNRGYNFDLPVDENGILVIPFGEFGWGPDILRTPIEKLSYYITDNGPGVQYDDDDRPIEEQIEEFKESPLHEKVTRLIYDNCPQVKEIKFASADSSLFGYVDHNSRGECRVSGLSLYDIVFNNSVIIIIDNDNSCTFYSSNTEELFDEREDWWR